MATTSGVGDVANAVGHASAEEKRMASGGAEVIKELAIPSNTVKGKGADMNTVVPMDASTGLGKPSWSKKKVSITVGDAVMWIYQSDVSFIPLKEEWFTERVADKEETVLELAVDKTTEEGRCYGIKFNKVGTFKIRTSRGGLSEKDQQTFTVSVQSTDGELMRAASCQIALYVLLAIVFGALVLIPMAVLNQASLVDSMLEVVTSNNARKGVITRSGKRIMSYFWPPFVGCILTFLFLVFQCIIGCCWPKPLSSYGRGFTRKQHRDIRIVHILFTFGGFVTLVVAWSFLGSAITGMKPVIDKTLWVGNVTVTDISSMAADMKKYNELAQEAGQEVDEDMAKSVEELNDLTDQATEGVAKGKDFMTTAVYGVEMFGLLLLQLSLIAYAVAFAASVSKQAHMMKASYYFALFALFITLLFSAKFGMMLAIYKGIYDEISDPSRLDAASSADSQSSNAEFTNFISYCSGSGGDAAMGSTFATVAATVGSTAGELPLTFPSAEASALMTVSELRSYVQAATKAIKDLNNRETLTAVAAAGMAGTNSVAMIELGLNVMEKLFKFMECTVMWESLSEVAGTFRSDVVEPFEDYYTCRMWGAAFLCLVIVTSKMGEYVLERPRKYWYCQETRRWFRFRACYKAHLRVLGKNRGRNEVLGMVVRSAKVWNRPMFTLANFWSELSLAFVVTIFIVFAQGILLLVYGAGNALLTCGAACMVLTLPAVGPYLFKPPQKKNLMVSVGLYLCALLKFAAICLLGGAAAQEASKYTECEEISYGATGDCAFGKAAESGKIAVLATMSSLTVSVALICGLGFYCCRTSFVRDQEEVSALRMAKRGSKVEDVGKESLKDDARNCGRFLLSSRAIPIYMLLLVLGALGFAWVILAAADKPLVKEATAEKVIKSAAEYTWCDTPDCCNGLASLCDRRYDLTVSAMSHNAYSSEQDGFSTPNHVKGIKESLEAGVRGLMLDLVTPASGVTKLCHKFCVLGQLELTEAFNVINTFLDENPREVITLINEQIIYPGRSKADQFRDVEAALENTGLIDKMWVQRPQDPWPTLREMTADGGKVVMFNYLHDPEHEWPRSPVDPSRPRKWNHHSQSFMVSNKYAYASRGEIVNKSHSCTIEAGDQRSPLYLVHHFITSPAADKSWGYLINYFPEMKEHAETCMGALPAPGPDATDDAHLGRVPNFLSVDFWSEGDVVAAALQLNEQIDPSRYPTPQPAASSITKDGGSVKADEYINVEPDGSFACEFSSRNPADYGDECKPAMWANPSACGCSGNKTQCFVKLDDEGLWPTCFR
jgi:hypothetical protein